VLVRSDAFSTLRGIIDEVCDKTGSRRPRNIILHAEPTFFVAQGRIDTYDGPLRGRTVALGMPLLRILSPVEIRSALTAEFSRFVGIDGIFEVIFTPVCAGFGAAVRSLADKPGDTREGALLRPLTEQSKRSKFGDATITIFQWPAVSFFKSVHLFLTSLEAAMNRRRVLRSDWIAAAQYGREAFTRSLRKVTGIGLHYQDALERVDRDGARTFFAAYADLAGVEKTQIAEAVEEEMGRGESEFSSQPSLAVRLASAPDGVAPVETYTTGLIQELAADEKRLAHRFGAKVEEIYGDGGEEVEFGFDNSVEDDDDYSES
jgi:hypothetical protein